MSQEADAAGVDAPGPGAEGRNQALGLPPSNPCSPFSMSPPGPPEIRPVLGPQAVHSPAHGQAALGTSRHGWCISQHPRLFPSWHRQTHKLRGSNKMLQTWRLKATRICTSTVLEARVLNRSCSQGCVPREASRQIRGSTRRGEPLFQPLEASCIPGSSS